MTQCQNTVGILNYRAKGWKQAVQENPHISINPVAAMIKTFTAAYAAHHNNPEPSREAVIQWIRRDPAKLAKVTSTFETWRTGMEAFRAPMEVEVNDGRVLESSGSATLDSTGFTLYTHQSQVTNWDDDAQVKALYYPDIAQHVKHLTGAALVFCNDHSIRCTENVGSGVQEGDTQMDPLGLSMKNPIPTVHNDFTRSFSADLARALDLENPTQARMATFGLLGQLKAAGITSNDLRGMGKYRVLMVNAWRNCAEHPLDTMPLAVCDSRTVGAESEESASELVDALAEIKGGVLDTVSSEACPGHEWYWYPKMRNDEVLLFKTFDSAKPSSRGQLHTAFQPKGSKPIHGRYSCETRVLCLVPNAPPSSRL